MKENQISFSNYDYIMFVDASGDDGFQFKERSCDGSSHTYAASCFITKPEDIEHNKCVLNNMKDELNLSHDKELKSTTLKRHRFSQKAYSHIKEFKGTAFSCIAFKKELLKTQPELCKEDSKAISSLIQTFPYYAINHSKFFNLTDKVLIVMDNMKKIEMDKVKKDLLSFSVHSNVSENYSVIFRDSKMEKYDLIQVADAISGTIRTYFEQEPTNDVLKMYCKTCKNFTKCNTSPSVRKIRNAKHIDIHFTDIFQLHTHELTYSIIPEQITPVPLYMYGFYQYINCKIKRS